MFRHGGFDTERHFRRPWSPEFPEPSPAVAATSTSFAPNVGRQGGHARQREPSDNSVEDVDLTDYALALRLQRERAQGEGPYALVNSELRSVGGGGPSSTVTTRTVPSLIHGPSTAPSSQTHALSSPPRSPIPIPARMQPLYQYQQPQYPISPISPTYPPIPHSHLPQRSRSPFAHSDRRFEFSGLDDDPDVSRFPQWSRRWFDNQKTPTGSGRGLPLPGGISSHSIPESELGFDPYGLERFYDRQLLPWSNQGTPSAGVTPETKMDRIKLLEREFAPLQSGRRGRVEPSETNIGSVDEKGHLITEGPKKRKFVRWMQGIFVLAAGGTSIYGALFIKAKVPANPAPPSGRPATYALYILSVLTFVAICYFFVIRPCCCAGKREDKENSYTGAPGMMVLPVQSMGRDKKKKKGGKKNKGMPMPQDVQVNLIVDPNAFGRKEDEEEEDSDEDRTRSGSGRGTDRERRRPKRRGFMEGLKLEAAWNRERSRLKKQITFDLVFMTLWSAQFVLIMIGPRCPPGGFEGWCNAFNTATAAACFLAVAFGMSVYFDIRDIHVSKVSPRSRT